MGSDAMNGSVRPVQESSYATNWKEVLAGWGMSCGVKEDGRLFCWGYDFFGQLGQGKDLRRTWPAGPLTD